MPDNQIKNNEQQEDQQLYERYLKTTSKQAGMVFGTRVIGYLLGFAMQAVFARFLGADKYGLYSLGLTVTNVGVLFGTFGLPTGMTRFLGEELEKKELEKAKGTLSIGFKWTLILSSLIAVAIFIFRKYIATNIFNDERLISLLPWFSITLILMAQIKLFSGIIRGFKKPSVYTFYKEVIERLIRIVIFILLFFLGIELLGVIIATLASSVIVLVRLLLWMTRNNKFILDKEFRSIKKQKTILIYSSNMLFVSFAFFLMGQVNRLLIGIFLSSKEVGLYSVSDTISQLVIFFLVAFITIFEPMVSELFHRKKVNMLSNLFSNVTRWVTLLSAPLFIWIIFFSENILSIFGNEYISSKWVLIVLATGQFIGLLFGPSGQILIMTKYQHFGMINGAIIASLNIILNLILIPLYGILGSAFAASISISSVKLIEMIEVFLLLKIHPYKLSFIKLFVSSIITSIVLYIFSIYTEGFISLLISLIISFSLFFIILIAQGLTPEDKMILRTVLKKIKNS